VLNQQHFRRVDLLVEDHRDSPNGPARSEGRAQEACQPGWKMLPHRRRGPVKKGVFFDDVSKLRKQLSSPPLNLDTAPVYLSQRFVPGNLSIELGNAAYAARPVRLRRRAEATGTPRAPRDTTLGWRTAAMPLIRTSGTSEKRMYSPRGEGLCRCTADRQHPSIMLADR